MEAQRRPIGYWAKRTHDALESAMNMLLDRYNLNRQHWQVLNTIGDSMPDWETLAQTMENFPDTERLRTLVEELSARGWVEESGEPMSFRLTEAAKPPTTCYRTTFRPCERARWRT